MPQVFDIQDKIIHIVAKKEYVGDGDSRGPWLWKAWVMENEGITGYGKERDQAIAECKRTAESLYEFLLYPEIEEESEYLSDEEITGISILRGSFGCTGCSNHFSVDPYYNRRNWNEAARGDGMSYSGSYGSVSREKGESLQALVARAEALANKIAEEYDLSCRNRR